MPPTEAQEALRGDFLECARATDGCRRTRYPAHLTASTLVLSADSAQVLLLLHGKAGRWFQMGGHVEPGDASLAAAALREASEESGIDGLVLDPVPVHLDRHSVGFCHPDGAVDHLDVRFRAYAPAGAQPVVSTESKDVRWWPIEALPTDEASVLDLVAAALARGNSPVDNSLGAGNPGKARSHGLPSTDP